jgi:hypothetical protein
VFSVTFVVKKVEKLSHKLLSEEKKEEKRGQKKL